MPTNLPPQYYEEEKKLRTARTPWEKIEIFENLLAIMPKHKGTNRLEGDIKRKIAKLKEDAVRVKSSRGKRANIYYVEKEGAGQVVLVGEPNVGKSSLLLKLTNANPQIADYPFTTKLPQPGMMNFKNVQVQLVDTPPLTRDELPGWLSDMVRRADAALLVIDLSTDDVIEQIENTVEMFQKRRLVFLRGNNPPLTPPLLKCGETSDCPPLLKGGMGGFEEIGYIYKPMLIIGTKSDINDTEKTIEILKDLYKDRFKILFTSALLDDDIECLKENVFNLLGIIRVFAKQPGKQADLDVPFTIKSGSKLSDLATLIHKDFEEKINFARVWGTGKFDAQRIHKNYILQDGDIIEFHI